MRNGTRDIFIGGMLCIAAACAGCTVGPDYKRADVDQPGHYKSATTQDAAASSTRQDWWTLFNDPQLNVLEEAALAHNYDLRAALARVEQARATAGVVAGGFYPSLSVDPSAARQRRGSSSNSGNNNGSGGNESSSRARTSNTFSLPVNLQYELDLWGRVRRSYEAATAQTQAAINDFGFTRLTLTADVAQNYFNLKSLDDQDRIIGNNVQLYQKQVDLTQSQARVGLVGPIDLLQAQTLLDSTKAQQVDIRRQRALAEHALAILIGRPPVGLAIGFNPLESLPPHVPVGMPGDLLRQRPDVASAEQNLVAANAQIGVAIANFYPQISLNASAGFQGSSVDGLLDWDNRFWSVGSGITAPLFQGGSLNANLRLTQARYDELLANYRTSVISAYRDVEDALTNLHRGEEQAAAQDRAVSSSREYLRLTELQYQQGVVAYLQVIDADRTLLSNELTASQLLNQRMSAAVLLFRALGGGWNASLEPSTQPTTVEVSH